MKKVILAVFLLASLSIQAVYVSQNGQDEYIHKNFFLNKTNGFFIDIGAHNGIKYSNSYFFEQFGWQGICIEPIPEVFEQLRKNRNCICIQGCISDIPGEADFCHIIGHCEMLSGLVKKYDPRHVQRIGFEATQNQDSWEIIKIPCYPLNSILTHYNLNHVDYVSIDTEGGELDILKSIDFDTYEIDVISVEDNYGYTELTAFLSSKGFVYITTIGQDLIFRNKKFIE